MTLKREVFKIKNDRKKKEKLFSYLNDLGKSDIKILEFYEQLLENPENIDKQILYNIFELLNLDTKILSGKEGDEEKVNMEEKISLSVSQVNEIVLKLIEINIKNNDKEIDKIIVDLLKMKNKEV